MVVAAALLAGCGSGEDDVSPRAVKQAAVKTGATTGFRLAMRSSIRFPGLDKPLAMPTGGAVDPLHGRGTLSADMSELIEASSGKVGDYHAKQLFDRRFVYVNAPWLSKDLHGKTWVKAPAGAGGGAVGSPLDRPLFGQIQQGPLYLIDQLRFPRGRAERLGSDTTGGAPATRYRVTVDLERWAKDPKVVDPASARFASGRFAAITGRSTYPAEVSIDRAGFVRRVAFKLTFEAKQVPGTPRIGFEQTMDLSDFGTRVDVHMPSPKVVAKDLSG